MAPKQQEEQKISIAEIKADFEAESEMFDDNEIEKIRDFLYLLAQIGYEQYQRQKSKEEIETTKVIHIKTNQQHESTESHIVYPCEYRRTG